MDPFPVFLSSGRVETNEIVAFATPAPADAFFGYRLKWHSHINQHPAGIYTGDTEPTPHNAEQVTHFLGLGWIDNFSDRLMISMRGIPSDGSVITWTSMRGIVTFRQVNGLWRSTSGKYELVDRGNPAPDIHGRWMVRTLDPHAVRTIWTFEEVSYTNYLGATETSGRLRRHALTNGNGVTGFYAIDVGWVGWTIATVTDSLNRKLEFSYAEFGDCDQPPTLACKRALANVSYRPHPAQAAISVVNLRYTEDGTLLDMVQREGHVSYTRFLYLDNTNTSPCKNCSGMLTDVVIPKQALATPLPGTGIASTEIAVEHHDYTTFLNGQRPLVKRSSGLAREYGYLWDEVNRKVIQYDLHQQKDACDPIGGGCPQGQTCRSEDTKCYVATEMS